MEIEETARIQMFRQWQYLEGKIKHLSGIFQNPMPISEEMIDEWETDSLTLIAKIRAQRVQSLAVLNSVMEDE